MRTQIDRTTFWRIGFQLLRASDLMCFLALLTVAFCFGERTLVWRIGLVLAFVGFALTVTARLQLGRSFSIRAKATELVTTGLYSRFRHPIYLFGTLSFFGTLLALQVWWLLAAWLLYATPIQVARLRREEAVLEEAFGDAFRQHRAKTWI